MKPRKFILVGRNPLRETAENGEFLLSYGRAVLSALAKQALLTPREAELCAEELKKAFGRAENR